MLARLSVGMRHRTRARRLTITAVAGAALIIGAPAAAQWKPTRNVEIVVGSAAGGAPDRTGRLVQKLLQNDPAFPSLSVTNRPGGAATIGAAYVNQHAGDPHVVLVTTPTMISNHIMGTTPLSHNDFTQLSVLFREYIVLAVRADSPIKNAKDLAERLKKDSGAASFAIASARGNHNHIVTGLVMKAAGGSARDAKVVVYNSGGQAMTAVLGGHVDIVVSAPANVAPQLESGKLRVLGLSASARLGGSFAGVPTFREQGLDVEFFAWRGLAAPRGLKPEQIAFWDEALSRMAHSEEWKRDVERNFWDGQFLRSAETRKHLDREYELTRGLLAELGLAK
jgi:putative tricarboxylic transport membrane protein